MATEVVGPGTIIAPFGITESSISVKAFADALVNDNMPFTWHFEYGASPAFGQVAPIPDGEVNLKISFPEFPLQVTVNGLQANTEYRFRVVTNNSSGQNVSGVQSITTSAPPPHDDAPPYDDVPYDDVPYDDVPYDDVPYDDVPYDDVPPHADSSGKAGILAEGGPFQSLRR